MWLYKNVFRGITRRLESWCQTWVTKLGGIWHILALKLNMEITNQFETRLLVWPEVWFESQCLLTLSEIGLGGHHSITFYSEITRLTIVGVSVSVVITYQQKFYGDLFDSSPERRLLLGFFLKIIFHQIKHICWIKASNPRGKYLLVSTLEPKGSFYLHVCMHGGTDGDGTRC